MVQKMLGALAKKMLGIQMRPSQHNPPIYRMIMMAMLWISWEDSLGLLSLFLYILQVIDRWSCKRAWNLLRIY